MPITRKKVIKTVYKDEEDESDAGDFSDSGSEAQISEQSSNEGEDEVSAVSSSDEFQENQTKSKKKGAKKAVRKPKFAKTFINKLYKQMSAGGDNDNLPAAPVLFSVKDLTEADKLLPSVLNLSESDSSDDESPKPATKQNTSTLSTASFSQTKDSDSDKDTEYKDVWSKNLQDSAEIARKTYMELQEQKNKLEETKKSVQQYTTKGVVENSQESDIKDLLALGEEVLPESPLLLQKKKKKRPKKDDSDSDIGDWEEVNEAKPISQQGLQLTVELPGGVCRKTKKVDVEMMMKRKINRVKKEYQVYMHKVHVLSWIAHGNYVNRVLNDQDILAVALLLVPSKDCYPGERVDMKYLEQITTWYKDKLTLKQDKHEDKFKPKAPPLKDILLKQMKTKTVSSKKNLVLVFISILRALGLQCRLMLNFVTVPLKPPSSELCSLSTKVKDEQNNKNNKDKSDAKDKNKKDSKSNVKKSKKIPQLDGNYDSDVENIAQLDGSDDATSKPRNTRSNKNKKETARLESESQQSSRSKSPHKEVVALANGIQNNGAPTKRTRKPPGISKKNVKNDDNESQGDVSPPKKARKSPSPRPKKEKDSRPDEIEDVSLPKRAKMESTIEISNDKSATNTKKVNHPEKKATSKSRETNKNPIKAEENATPTKSSNNATDEKKSKKAPTVSERTRSSRLSNKDKVHIAVTKSKAKPPKIIVTKETNSSSETSKYFEEKTTSSRNRSSSVNPKCAPKNMDENTKTRTKSAPGTSVEKSKYFDDCKEKITSRTTRKKLTVQEEDKLRVSHKDLAKKSPQGKPKLDVTGDLIDIIKSRVKEAKEDTKRKLVKAVKFKEELDDDSDFLLEEPSIRKSESDDDFKPTKISPGPKPSTSRKLDRRVLSSEDEGIQKNKCNVWCEVYVEELEQWISVDVIKAKVHCVNELYSGATHPVCYVVGWDNNNHAKDLTRRYVPQWNTVTRKLRAESQWWEKAIRPWVGPKTARDREEDESLDRLQIEAPLPKSISEYKNHPLYALKRHLLKFEAIYPPDAPTLGFVRNEPVYSRDCVYTCKSRIIWLKEAKVVKLGEQPYKVVKARPKWDKLSDKLITDKLLEIFGPWQVNDYEPPTAENGMVPRNEYGNVELFKECMLPKGTVHIKLPGLNKVARNLNIDCAPAMTGFDYSGGWAHPVYDGFVVCKEFEEIVVEAWLKDQEEQVRREREKTESRVYGNWKKLIRGLLIRERLQDKYGFENKREPEKDSKKLKGPRFVAKKK